MQSTLESLVSELTSYGRKNEWLRGNIRSLDPSLVFIAGMIFIHALLFCCRSVTIVRKFSHIKFSMVSVVPTLPMFVSNPTLFYLFYHFSERLCKPEIRLGYIPEFETAENRTFLVMNTYQIVNGKSVPTESNLITFWELGVSAKYCRCEGSFAVANTYKSDPKRGRAIDTVWQT